MSSTSSVMMMAKTPSVSASTREASRRRSSRVESLPGVTSSPSFIGAALTGPHAAARPAGSRPRALDLIEEPDVLMERGQAACQRLARPAQLLKAGRHLVVAQAGIVAARPADDLIPPRVPAYRMAADHADRLRPQNGGVVVMPGGAVTAGHGAIVYRKPQARLAKR